ncbi:MAG: hypothetical protein CMF98_06605 [Candidatus Marinimicrobia bacterium]|nr:hypothetical protein [Candidatus Neomarinimicrobiota bacterium]|tara:strand:- start:6599 stop:7552 length:954 start_codon:yes stop_codon:yes gene_type:complete
MGCYRELDKIPSVKNTILTIGTFDGLHLGHQKILNKITNESNELNLKSVLITFDPKPSSILFKKKNDTLTPIKIKIKKIEKAGIDIILILKFDKKFSKITADEFLRDFILIFKPKKIIIGYNHGFGKNRMGDVKFLKSNSKKFNFDLEVVSQIKKKLIEFSSTEIRNNIKNGKIDKASNIIGNNYNFYAKRISGKGFGKKIGFPTINFKNFFENQLIPKNGVYFTKIKLFDKYELFDDKQFYSMTNIGFRPTINDNVFQMESHIISDDFVKLNNNQFNIEFIKRIRNEIRFSSLDNLKLQLEKDKKLCLKFIKNLSN